MWRVVLILALLAALVAAALTAFGLLNCWIAGGYWLTPFTCFGMG